MSTTSTVVAFRSALRAALEGHATVTTGGVQVADGWKGPDTQAEGVYLTDLSLASEWGAFGGVRDETYLQTVVVQTWRAEGADTPQSHDKSVERVIGLFAALEDVLRAAPQMGGVDFARVTAGALETVTFETGWAARFTVVVTVDAQLT